MQRSIAIFAVVLFGCPTAPNPPDAATGIGGGFGGAGGGIVAGGGGTGGGFGGGIVTGGGTGGGEVDAGPPPELALAAFCSTFAAAACSHLAACNQYESASSSLCLETQARDIARRCAKVMEGRSIYDPRAGFDCIAEMNTTPPQCFSNFPPCGRLNSALGGFVGGTVFVDPPETCAGAVCATNTACSYDCTGPSCNSLRALGQSCSEGRRPYAVCDPTTGWCGPDALGNSVCQPFALEGESCLMTPCPPSLGCVYNSTGTTGVCSRPADAGAACTNSGAGCVDFTCRSDGFCGPLALGATCTVPADCGRFDSGRVCKGLVRSADGGVMTPGQCLPRPRLGEACSFDWNPSSGDPCENELRNGCIDGVCRALNPASAAEGTECPLRPYGRVEIPFYAFGFCQRGLTCQPSTTANAPRTGRCAPGRPLGTPCRDSLMCEPGLECSQGVDGGSTCQLWPRIGEACRSNTCRLDASCRVGADGGSSCVQKIGIDAGCGVETCLSDLTCDGTVCTLTGGPGTSCSYDTQCLDRACQGGTCVAMCIR